MPPLPHIFTFACACLFLAVSVRLAAAQPPSLTGIEVVPDGCVTVRGSGTAGARYNLYRTETLGGIKGTDPLKESSFP